MFVCSPHSLDELEPLQLEVEHHLLKKQGIVFDQIIGVELMSIGHNFAAFLSVICLHDCFSILVDLGMRGLILQKCSQRGR